MNTPEERSRYKASMPCHEFCVREGWEYEYLTLEHHGHFSFGLVQL